jgi:lipid A 3-O-deacylase
MSPPLQTTAPGVAGAFRFRGCGTRLVVWLSLVMLLVPGVSDLSAATDEGPGMRRLGFLTGYGETHPGLGDTSQKVRTVDLMLRYRTTLKETGQGWYRGIHDLIVELPVSWLLEPEDRPPILGINFLACWTLRCSDVVWPSILLGGGPIYTEAEIPGMSTRWNGNYQAGCGVLLFPTRRWTWVLEYRFHHISNGGRKEPNDPLNSSKGLVGLEYRF